MLRDSTTMSGFSVDDPEAARGFYEDILGLRVEAGDHGFLMLKVADGRDVLVYPSPQHRPASYTVLNFHVPDIEAAVRDLDRPRRGVREVRRHADGHRRPRACSARAAR